MPATDHTPASNKLNKVVYFVTVCLAPARPNTDPLEGQLGQTSPLGLTLLEPSAGSNM
jgi:hypothetical protein